MTGVHLDGNAAAWWPHAEGRYERGHKPQVAAILVFKPYGRMRVGHVAVVSRIVSSREVLVDQANWVRGRVTKAISVVDASPGNDWTSVKVQYAGTHGRDNPTYGFIYPHGLPTNFGDDAVAAAEPDEPHATSTHSDRVAEHARRHEKAADDEVAAYHHAALRHAAERTEHHRSTDDTQVAEKSDPPRQHAAERTKHRKDADDQETATQTDPAPQRAVAHDAHRNPAHAEAGAYQSEQPAQQLAAATPTHHKHKDPRVAYVLY